MSSHPTAAIALWLGWLVSGAPADEPGIQESLALAQKTLDFVQKSAPCPELAGELAALEKRFAEAQAGGAPAGDDLEPQVRRLRRRILFSHPLLAFDKLLINKRPPPGYSHQSRQYLGRYSGAGPGLVVLDSWKDAPKETVLLEGKLPAGSVLHPDLSFDAKRVLFAFCDHTPSDPNISCFSPIPVKPRAKPPVLPPRVEPQEEEATGTFYVRNVYHSTQPIPRGSVKSLRVVRLFPQPIETPPSRGKAIIDMPKRIEGTAPVGEDGSVAFRAPAGRPLLFQLLDENGMAVMSMRTLVYLQPGETAGCAGCHEPRSSATQRLAIPAGVTIHDLRPPAGPRYEGGLSFARTVQPVLDRYCIGCHGLDKTEGDVDLLGRLEPVTFPYPTWPGPNEMIVSRAYESLMNRPELVNIAQRNFETDFSTPKDYFSHAGRLAGMLLAGHKDENGNARVELDRESFQRIVDWLDTNAMFYGDYSWNKPEWRKPAPEGEKALREHAGDCFGPEMAGQPFAALVNVAEPSESRILKAPLAADAGGWGQLGQSGWASTSHPGYQAMRQLVEASFAPLEFGDVAG